MANFYINVSSRDMNIKKSPGLFKHVSPGDFLLNLRLICGAWNNQLFPSRDRYTLAVGVRLNLCRIHAHGVSVAACEIT